MIGVGNYLIHTNKTYFGVSAGVNFNNEKFTGDETATQSGEAFFGAQYNIFNIGDLDILTNVVAYPSLTEKGRFRSDFKLDFRYEFKFDLYFKVGTTMNYDNQPTEGASELDYIFQTTVGWKL
jgi:putative salt-induced outer membrane protein YdiY